MYNKQPPWRKLLPRMETAAQIFKEFLTF